MRPAILVLALMGCKGDKDTPNPADTEQAPDADTEVTQDSVDIEITVRATYARPGTTPWDGLDYGATTTHPIRHAEAWVGDASTLELIDEGLTDGEGLVTLVVPTGVPVRAGVATHAPAFALQVIDNTAGDALYTLVQTRTFTPQDDGDTWSLFAGLAHDGQTYTDRAGAPFAVFDTAVTVFETVDPTLGQTPPALDIHWSPFNVPVRGDKSLGEIRTSHWDDDEGIFLLGAEDVDTDEFDPTVIAHEWVHYFENTIARSDSKGGSHSSDATLHMSVAFSEGSASGLGCLALGTPLYRDSDDARQADSWQQDLEDNAAADAVGWYGSRSASSIVWDLADPQADEADDLALPLSTLRDLWVGPLAQTPAFTSLFALGATLRAEDPSWAPAVDALWQREQMVAPLDPWGTGEVNDGGDPEAITPALYRPIGLGETATLSPFGPASEQENRIGDYRYYRYTAATDASVEVSTIGEHDIDLRVFHRGDLLDSSRRESGDEDCVIQTQAGEDYVIEIDGTYLDDITSVTLTVRETP